MRMLEGERVLWQGRPCWRALARDAVHVRLVALYFGVALVWHLASDRAEGLSPIQALLGGVPLVVMGALVAAACALFAWGCARSATYTITTERCVLRFGIALQGTLSVPLRQVAAVAVAARDDGAGTVALALKPGRAVAFLKLWPHARPGRIGRPEPALRCVPGAEAVGLLLSRAVAAVTPGRVLTPPAGNPAPGPAMLPAA